MSATLRPRLRTPAVALVSSLVLAVLAAGVSGAGESKRSTTTWSSSASGKGVRSETRRSTPGGSYYSTTVSGAEDGPAEVDAWTFSRENGHWRNTSGSERDRDEVQSVLERTDGDLFWFRRGSDRYLVTDTGVMRQLADLFAPQEELGHKQGELGRKQGELGRLQGELGRKQGELGRMQARLGRRQAALSLEQASRGRRDLETATLDRELDALSRQQAEVEELQSELGAQQSELGERQSVLGERQSELGREQERASQQVARELARLTRDWIASGLAKRIDR